MMFQMFNFNLNNFYNRENSNKFIFIGILLLICGVYSLFNKHISINILSWAVSLLFLFIAYMNLKNINELKRYASKEEIKPYTYMQIGLLIAASIFLFFPSMVQKFISSMMGIYLLFREISSFINNKDNPYYKFGFFNVLKLIFGVILIISPFFLSNFISSIISFIIISIGLSMISTGNRIKRL